MSDDPVLDALLAMRRAIAVAIEAHAQGLRQVFAATLDDPQFVATVRAAFESGRAVAWSEGATEIRPSRIDPEIAMFFKPEPRGRLDALVDPPAPPPRPLPRPKPRPLAAFVGAADRRRWR
jgi:hypothetical protein